jgi:hypothetical protein
MTPARKVAIVLVAVGVAGLAAVSLATFQRTPRQARLLDAVPEDAFVAVDLDVDALRTSGTLRSLFSSFDPDSLKIVCGVDPIDRLHELVFSVPEGASSDYGVAARADLTRAATVTCAQQLATARGDDPSTVDTTRGAFAVFTPKNALGDGKLAARALAFRDGGPILLGHGDWLNRMIDAADDARGGREPAGPHLTLRESLADGLPRGARFDVTATMLLRKSEREELQLSLSAQLPRAEAAGLGGLLGVSSVSLGLYEQGDDVRAAIDIACDEEPQCANVQQVVAKLRIAWTANPAVRALGVGPALDGLVVEREGARLRMRTSTKADDLVRWAKPFLQPKASTNTVASSSSAAAAPPTLPPPVDTAQPGASASTVPVTVPLPSSGASASAAPLRLTVPGPR